MSRQSTFSLVSKVSTTESAWKHNNIDRINYFIFAGFDGFDVRKIDDIEYTVEISCYFLTKWRDDRLILHENILGAKMDPDEEEQWYPIDLEFVDKVGQKSEYHCNSDFDS